MNVASEGMRATLVQAPLADGQAATDSSNVDMAADGGYDGVWFIGVVGTITGSGTATLLAQQAATDIAGDALSGMSVVATAAADSDKILGLDIYRPTDRYVGTKLTRATANSVYGGTIALQYRGRSRPTTHLAATLAAAMVSAVTPAEA